MIMMFLFSPEINLLQNNHDIITQKFVDGIISFKDYENYEIKYNEIRHLFLINLN